MAPPVGIAWFLGRAAWAAAAVIGMGWAGNAGADEVPAVAEAPTPSAAAPADDSGSKAAATAAALTSPARAQSWTVWGEARARQDALLGMAGDGQNTTWTRLVAGGKRQVTGQVAVELELEALSGLAGGDRNPAGTAYTPRPFLVARDSSADLRRVLPRKAALTWTTAVGQVVAGVQTMQWGTGMLANDGAHASDFGDPWQGNVVARLALGTKPLAHSNLGMWLKNLTVFAAGDFVLRDDNASVQDGDRALAAVLGARTAGENLQAGLLLAGRTQTDRTDPWRPDGKRSTVDVLTADLWLRWARELTGARLVAEGEAALVMGRSTRPYGDETWRDGTAVRQLGAVLRALLEHGASHSTWKLEVGYASGDNDPRDATARQFAMHSDYNVGLVLFDHVLPVLQARAVDRLADPGLLAVRPPSARFAVSSGQVHNAIYLNPVVRWRPVPPLDVRLGWVWARAAADVADAYQTAVHAGYPTTPGGAVQGGRMYGHELDIRATWDVPMVANLVLRVGAEAGLFLPGSALAGAPDLGTPWLGRGLASLVW